MLKNASWSKIIYTPLSPLCCGLMPMRKNFNGSSCETQLDKELCWGAILPACHCRYQAASTHDCASMHWHIYGILLHGTISTVSESSVCA